MAAYREHLKSSCERCGFDPHHTCQLEIHHLDLDHANNDPANLQTLCANCHTLLHRTGPRVPRRPRRSPREPRERVRFNIDLEHAEERAAIFRALSDPARVAIVIALAGASEACVEDLRHMLALSQPTVSHHLRVLRQSGIVGARSCGTLRFYHLLPEVLEQMQALTTSA